MHECQIIFAETCFSTCNPGKKADYFCDDRATSVGGTAANKDSKPMLKTKVIYCL